MRKKRFVEPEDQAMASRIKAVRLERGMSQVVLAKLSGLTTGCVCQVERGLRVPNSQSIRKIGLTLEVSFDYLFLGRE